MRRHDYNEDAYGMLQEQGRNIEVDENNMME